MINRYKKIRVYFSIKKLISKNMLEGDPEELTQRLIDWSTLVIPEAFNGYGNQPHHWSITVVLVLAEGLTQYGGNDPIQRAVIHSALGGAIQQAQGKLRSEREVYLMESAIHLFVREDYARRLRMNDL